MAVDRRLGGLPLAVYVIALLVLPLTAVGIFSVREVERNNSESATADAVAEVAALHAFASRVYSPLEVERTALIGLARIDEIGVPRDGVILVTGVDFEQIRTSNAVRLDDALSALGDSIEEPDARRRHTDALGALEIARTEVDGTTATVDGVVAAFDQVFSHIEQLLVWSELSLSALEFQSVEAASVVRRLDSVTAVVVTARMEMATYTEAALGVEEMTPMEMAAGGIRHIDALDVAQIELPLEIGELRRLRAELPKLPTDTYSGLDLDLDLDLGVDAFSVSEVLNVTQGLLEHVQYLNAVDDFASLETARIQDEVNALARDAGDRNRFTFLVLLLVGVVSVAFTTIVIRSFGRPLQRLRLQAERITGGELHAESLVIDGPSDIRKVTRAVNDMASTLSLVEDHMEALAGSQVGIGPELRELPGHVGASMRTSMERITALTTRLQMSEMRLAEEARIDNLTGLANRFAVLEYLEQVLRRSVDRNSDVRRESDAAVRSRGTAVMFLDVDGFKSVNDTHGHAVGDIVLRDIAQRLRGSIREIDFVARLGGDEFIVVVGDIDDTEILVGFAERMIEQVEQPYKIGDQLFVVSASVGVTFLETGDNSMAAIERADAAVYQAKQRGRRRVEMFDKELQRSIEHHAELELALRQAIKHDELRMYLQPLADLSTGLPSGAEALVRWERPGVGLVSPGDFIPIAERSGLIFELERWMLNTACERVASWQHMGLASGMRLAVNISGRHLIEGDLLADLDDAIARSGADPCLLEIELTESQLLDDVPRACAVLDEVRKRGIKVAIDDFGTGYSSMTYLQKLPVDIVKIDRSFIVSATTSEFDSTIVDTVVTIGRALALEVVAEGIETDDQLSYAMRAGVTLGQGYLFARPMPADEAEAIIFNGPLFDVERIARSAAPRWLDQAPSGPPIDVG